MVVDVEKFSDMLMCISCEQTFTNEYIYNNHTCEGEEGMDDSTSNNELIIVDDPFIKIENDGK